MKLRKKLNYINASSAQPPSITLAYRLTRFFYYGFLVFVVAYLSNYAYQRMYFAKLDGMINIQTHSITAPVAGIVEKINKQAFDTISKDEKVFTISHIQMPTAFFLNEKLRVEKQLVAMLAKKTSLQARKERLKQELINFEKSAMFETRLNLEDKIRLKTESIHIIDDSLFNLNKQNEAEVIHLKELDSIVIEKNKKKHVDVFNQHTGKIEKIHVQPGLFVLAGSILLTFIPNDAQIWIDALVPVDTFSHLKPGSIAKVTFDNGTSNVNFTAKVVQVNPENSQFQAVSSDVASAVVIRLIPETHQYDSLLKRSANFSVNLTFEL
ncbi:MAG: HlyD family efflux transporter periplasmic adaptor subunit [Colwellia sp.]|nr:HlyD family efflux transporter periplasmic adaptor subunit [Colwellia sp.]